MTYKAVIRKAQFESIIDCCHASISVNHPRNPAACLTNGGSHVYVVFPYIHSNIEDAVFHNIDNYLMSQKYGGDHTLEKCLRKALAPLGEGFDLDIIEAMIDHYEVDFKDESELSISGIESSLRELLGSGAELFIDRFYEELNQIGYNL